MEGSYGCILTVDNDASFRHFINGYLEDSGFTTFEAATHQEAKRLLKEKKPDVVLSDLQMQEDNGLALLEFIQQEFPDTPVIVMSQSNALDILLEALYRGAWGYIIKPVKNRAVLEQTVCLALERGRLVLENKRYKEALEEKNHQLSRSLAQLKEDQKAGKSVQQQLLPNAHFFYEGYEFSQKIFPSLYLSGDFIDYFEVNKQLICFYIVDVSGHGASSAFVTVMIKSLIEKLLLSYQLGKEDTILHPDQVLKYISDTILDLQLGKHLTMIFCLLNTKTGNISYSNGGHYPYPVFVKKEKAEFLESQGFVVGVYDKAHFESKKYHLEKDSILYFFSDGILDVIQGSNFKEKEKELLNVLKKSNGSIESIIQEIGGIEEEAFPDDIAMLLVKNGN